MKAKEADNLDEEAMNFMTTLGRVYGFPDLQSKVIALLYLEPDEISMEDIAEKTGYSLASISNTMKMLEAFGTIARRRKPGTKKAYFYMEKNLAKLNIMKFTAMQNNFLGPAKEILPALIKKYKNRVKDEKSKRKIAIAENYYKQLLCFEGMIAHWIGELEEMSAKNAELLRR
jgi:DNA-binding transcriptional regulator GbsR (MarR family)